MSLLKRACQPRSIDFLSQRSLIESLYVIETDENGLIEYIEKKDVPKPSKLSSCALCSPEQWIFHGSQYDPSIAVIYAERDGCIPSSVILFMPKFIVPWRYRNKRTGEVSWKIFHLTRSRIQSADSETIIVNPSKDEKLRNVMTIASETKNRYKNEKDLVEYLLRLVRATLGDYGMPHGPSSLDADASLYRQMCLQGHNFLFLCQVEIGLCRHKALLFKILCDRVGIKYTH